MKIFVFYTSLIKSLIQTYKEGGLSDKVYSISMITMLHASMLLLAISVIAGFVFKDATVALLALSLSFILDSIIIIIIIIIILLI